MEEKAKRNMDIIAMFSCGVKKSEIARRVGVSPWRVSQILSAEERRKNRMETDEFYGLSVRARNCLRSGGYHSKDDIKRDVYGGCFPRKKITNFGKKCAEEVLLWLES